MLINTNFNISKRHFVSRYSSVGIALGYGLDDRGSMVRFPAGARNFSLHRVHNGSKAHPTSYPMGTRGSFRGGKAVGA
jgi:glutamine synthetase